MIYGTKILKNGTMKGILKFASGKTVRMNVLERHEFERWLRDRLNAIKEEKEGFIWQRKFL